jgi:hypothetical protein
VENIHFKIDAGAHALRAAAQVALAELRANHPGWTFTAEFGISVIVTPVPDQDSDTTADTMAN